MAKSPCSTKQTEQWIEYLLHNSSFINICARCCQELVICPNELFIEIVGEGYRKGQAERIIGNLRGVGIGDRYPIIPRDSDNTQYVCQKCWLDYDHEKETYNDWLIEEKK